MGEDKRVSGRRRLTRRSYDLLAGRLSDEERLLCDMLAYGKYFTINRRARDRRSGGDRRRWLGAERLNREWRQGHEGPPRP